MNDFSSKNLNPATLLMFKYAILVLLEKRFNDAARSESFRASCCSQPVFSVDLTS